MRYTWFDPHSEPRSGSATPYVVCFVCVSAQRTAESILLAPFAPDGTRMACCTEDDISLVADGGLRGVLRQIYGFFQRPAARPR